MISNRSIFIQCRAKTCWPWEGQARRPKHDPQEPPPFISEVPNPLSLSLRFRLPRQRIGKREMPKRILLWEWTTISYLCLMTRLLTSSGTKVPYNIRCAQCQGNQRVKELIYGCRGQGCMCRAALRQWRVRRGQAAAESIDRSLVVVVVAAAAVQTHTHTHTRGSVCDILV